MHAFRSFIEATDPFQTKAIVDPALLTFDEFFNYVNKRGKTHPSSAYQMNLKDFATKGFYGKQNYPDVMFRREIRGIPFEFRLRKEDNYDTKHYVKKDENGDIVRIDGEVQYYTREEVQRLGFKRYEYSIGVFHGDTQVASVQDEWGCVLVMVAKEYRGFGIGPIITKIAWELEPGKDTGGCTVMGWDVVKKVHQEFVREYLQKGYYSYLVRDGKMTPERVKQVIASANLPSEKKKPREDMNTDNPENWLLYGEDGAFIIYDKKLKNLIHMDDDAHYWKEKAIKGLVYIGGTYTTKEYQLHTLGAENEQLKKFLLMLAASWMKESDDWLRLFDDELPLIDKHYEVKKKRYIKIKEPIEYKAMTNAEKQWRRRFDKYDEFKVQMLEMAFAKYQQPTE